jgi:hypothetical protein
MRKTRVKVRTCAHFTGIQHDCCRAGVRYHELVAGALRPGWAMELPCLDAALDTCSLRRFPTPEEEEAAEREWQAAFSRMVKARAAIIEAIGEQRGVNGNIACPCCDGGRLWFRRASNGHIHAVCSTEGCARWME